MKHKKILLFILVFGNLLILSSFFNVNVRATPPESIVFTFKGSTSVNVSANTDYSNIEQVREFSVGDINGEYNFDYSGSGSHRTFDEVGVFVISAEGNTGRWEINALEKADDSICVNLENQF